MKKTLALILALLMILTLALASCGKEEEETQEPTDNFFNVGGKETDEGDETGEGDETDGEGNVTAAGYTTASGTVYVLFDAILREDDKTSSDKVAEVKFGTALQRTAKSKKWTKVNYNGAEAYIANDLITTEQKAVTFKDVEADTVAKVSISGQGTLNLRKYPLALTNPTVIDLADFNNASILGKVDNGAEVKILQISEDGVWAKIECQAKAMNDKGEFAAETSTMTGYCALAYTDYNSGASNNSGSGALG